MLDLNFNPFPIILSERLLLRQVSMNDVNEIFFLRSDPSVMRYIDRPPAQSTEDAATFIKMINDLENNNEAITWAITIKDQPTLIGTFCFWNIRKEHFRAEIGYVLHPGFHGKGIIQETMATVLNYGFNVMKLHSVEANVNPENAASVKLLERNKFIREGFFRENYFYDGKFLDSAIYSLLAPKELSNE